MRYIQSMFESAGFFYLVRIGDIPTPDPYNAATTAACLYHQASHLERSMLLDTPPLSRRERAVFLSAVCVSVAVKYCMASVAAVNARSLLAAMTQRAETTLWQRHFGPFYARLFEHCELRLVCACHLHAASDNARTRTNEILCALYDNGSLPNIEVVAVADAVAVQMMWSVLVELMQESQWEDEGRGWAGGLVVASLQCVKQKVPRFGTMPVELCEEHVDAALHLLDLRVGVMASAAPSAHALGPDIATTRKAAQGLRQMQKGFLKRTSTNTPSFKNEYALF